MTRRTVAAASGTKHGAVNEAAEARTVSWCLVSFYEQEKSRKNNNMLIAKACSKGGHCTTVLQLGNTNANNRRHAGTSFLSRPPINIPPPARRTRPTANCQLQVDTPEILAPDYFYPNARVRFTARCGQQTETREVALPDCNSNKDGDADADVDQQLALFVQNWQQLGVCIRSRRAIGATEPNLSAPRVEERIAAQVWALFDIYDQRLRAIDFSASLSPAERLRQRRSWYNDVVGVFDTASLSADLDAQAAFCVRVDPPV